MAEIKIEQKKTGWIWLVVGLVIAALLVYFLVFNDKNTEAVTEADYITNTDEQDLLGVKENNSTVAAFVSFVENDTNRMSLDHAYLNEALIKLTSATNAMAGEIGYDIQTDLDRVKESSTLIANEPFETTHADNIRKAADNSNTALQNMQQAKYPSLADEVAELKSASESIKPGVLALEQKDAVKNYFEKAADILQKMN